MSTISHLINDQETIPEIEDYDKNHTNYLYKNFTNEVSEDMSTKALVILIVKNSIFGIWCKIMLTLMESVTISYLRLRDNNSFDEFYVYFTASLIQNIGFKCIGFGIINTAVVLSSQYFGRKDFYGIGCLFNKAKFLIFVYSIFCLIFSLFGRFLIKLFMGDKYLDEIQRYLLISIIYIFFYLFTSISALYLNSQNQYLIPALIDTIAFLTQFFLFKIAYSIFDINSFKHDENLNLIAWVINFNAILHYSYYNIYIFIKNPSPETNFLPNKDTFSNLSEYLILSLQFIAYFLTHFLGNEILVIILNRKYQFIQEKVYLFDVFKIVQNYLFLIQKFPIGLSFVSITLIGNFITKRYFSLIKRLIKVIVIITSVICLLVGCFTVLFSNFLTNFYLKKDQHEYYENVNFYLKLIILIFIPYCFENIFQGILIPLGRQIIVTIVGISVIVFGGLITGLIFITWLSVELTGLYLIMLILEVFLMSALILVFSCHKIDQSYEKVCQILSK